MHSLLFISNFVLLLKHISEQFEIESLNNKFVVYKSFIQYLTKGEIPVKELNLLTKLFNLKENKFK